MKPTSTARLAALLLLFVSPGTGGTLTVFGPETYVRADGSPREVTRTFTVPNPNGTYTLHIDNGGTNHQGTKVSSGTVELNGVEVVSSSDFSRNTLTIDETVTLRSANRLTVELHGQPGGTITLSILGKDNAVPIITAAVTPTPNGAGWNNSNLTVSFKCSDPGGVIASCSQPVAVQTETDGKTVTGTAVDSNKNSATAKVTVKLDKTLPAVTTSVSPNPNSNGWNNSNVTVTFRASDALSGIASVTGPATVSAEGASQTVSGTAVDGAGNSRTVSATVKLDKTAPVLTVGSPVTESVRLIDFVTLKGTVVDSLSGVAKVACNGFPAVVSGNAFSCTVILVFGASSITVAATDQAGNTASSVVKVTSGSIDVNVSPATATLYGGQTQQFAAAVKNANNTAVTWTASVGTISATGLYTAPASVTAQQSVTVTATSQADGTKSDSATVTLRPAITVSVTPAAATLTGGQTRQFTAAVTNTGNTAVTWSIPAGSPGNISATGLYTAPAVVASGQTVTVTATSQADNTKSATASVTLSLPVSVTVAPGTATLSGGQTQQFLATVTNTSNTAVTWTISPAGTGTISGGGLYTAPSDVSAPQTVTITATSQSDSTKKATATVTLSPPVGVTVAPGSATLSAGQTQQFTAKVTNAGNTAVTWSVNPATGAGTIGSNGLYTAPASITAPQTVTITATSQADSTKQATAAVTLSPAVSITVAPGAVTLSVGQTQQFTATVSNTGNTAVTWTISPATGAGAISGGGLYTAPASITAPQTVTITATSQADSTKQATATVTLSPTVSITVSPGAVTLSSGQTQQFTATVGSASNTAVTWTISPATGSGTISGSGLYAAPASITAPQTVTITATSQADSTKQATATVTLSPAVSITVAPGSITLSGGQTQQFTATVINAGNTTVTWSVNPATGAGTISGSGLYIAPANIAAPQTVAITATSQADPMKQATATVTLSPPPVSVSVNPPAGTLSAGQAMQLTAGVQNSPNTAVTWSISPAGTGTVSPSGYYTAPIYIGSQVTATITATSVADPTRYASAAVTLLPGSFAPIRVNAGGPAYIDPQGVLWNASNGFSSVPSGVPTAFFFSPPAGSNIPLIYQSGLYTNSAPIQYRAEVPNGQYLVTLKFADPIIEFDTFDVSINGVNVLPQTNVYAAVGQYHPWDARVPVNVTDGQITIVFTAVSWYAVINAIEIVAANSVEVLSHDPALALQQTLQFTARVQGAGSQAVIWSIQPNIGTISSTGLYTAPSTLAVPEAVTVTATSVENPNLAGTSVISLNPVSASAIVPVRVNAGGPSYTDPQGVAWSASNGFSSLPSGVPSPFAFTPPPGSNIAPIYQTGLLSNSAPIQYQADVPNGQYLVTLKFADSIIEFDTFDVSINGVAVLSHLNVYATAGQYQPWDATFPVNVTNGQITIVFSPVSWNAVINAIQIVPAGVN